MKGEGTPIFRRAVVAIVLLLGFYGLALAVAGSLLAVPLLYLYGVVTGVRGATIDFGGIAVSGLCLITSALIARGVFFMKRPVFEAPGPRLNQRDAPAFFALLEDVAREVGTAPPATVFLSPGADAGVNERTLHGNRERVLVIGLPLFRWLTVQELRSVIAHELGHYAGGETRLLGLVSWTRALFLSVLESTHRPHNQSHALVAGMFDTARVIGGKLVGAYAKLYLHVTMPASRDDECAADLLAGRIAGPRAAKSALEKIHVLAPIHDAYYEVHVGRVVQAGGVPSDLFDGLGRFRAHLVATGTEAELVAEVRAKKTDPYDSHPALQDRIAILDAVTSWGSAPAEEEDERLAEVLLAFDVEEKTRDVLVAMLKEAGLERPVVVAPWSDIAPQVLVPSVRRQAEAIAARLGPSYPQARGFAMLLGEVTRTLQAQRLEELALAVDPSILMIHRNERGPLVGQTVTMTLQFLLHGALAEAGAAPSYAFDDVVLTYTWRNESIQASRLAIGAMSDGAACARLLQLAADLEAGVTSARIAG